MSRMMRVAAVAGALVGVGALVLMLGVGRAQPPVHSSDVSLESAIATSEPWPINARGQTYGITVDGREPDLVRVAASNNRVGYSSRAELNGPTPSSPEEALRWQAAQAGKVREVPVYQADGVTQIGVFRIGEGVTITQE
ncbi:MAG: hypothetical protein FDZ75_00480 [Actinobacteria bacterium]|nr:MAG: hypothetical protein FDZ75_00480 [Actinomycetota bacterium]